VEAGTSGLELVVLGAGPAYTDRQGATGAAYLLRQDATTVLLDLGQGSFPALAGAIEPSLLDGIFISHLHPDHFIDLVPLRHYLRYQFTPPRGVTVYAPQGLADRLDALHDEPGFAATAFRFEPVRAKPVTLGALEVTAGLVTHTAESYAFRVSGNVRMPGLVYSGDCGRAADLRPLLIAGDVLLAEVSFGPGPVPPDVHHLAGPEIGTLATEAAVSRILLTHLQMGFDPASTIASVKDRFGGPVELVAPGFRTIV
jgi:ribonuclease BN (tRNA processing enzyme)